MENIARAMVMFIAVVIVVKSRNVTIPKNTPKPRNMTGAWWACFLPMVLGHVGRTCTHHLVASPPPFENLKGAFENIPGASVIIDRLMQLILLMLMGKAFKCNVCGASFKYGNDKVNRSKREECRPGNKQKTNLMRKCVNILFLILATTGRSCQPQGGGQGSQLSVT